MGRQRGGQAKGGAVQGAYLGCMMLLNSTRVRAKGLTSSQRGCMLWGKGGSVFREPFQNAARSITVAFEMVPRPQTGL